MPQLQYAPPTLQRAAWPVIACGIGSSVLATLLLLAAHMLGGIDFVGVYIWVLPVGAFIGGILAGSGFGLGAWWAGRRPATQVVVIAAGAAFCAYWEMQLVDAAGAGGGGGSIFAKFHRATTSMVWSSITSGARAGAGRGEPLGAWGYALRLFEMIAFLAGAMTPMIVLARTPYCELCKAFMKPRNLGAVAIQGRPRGLLRRVERDAAATEAGQRQVQELIALVDAGDAAGFYATIKRVAVPTEKASKSGVTARIEFTIAHCRGCGAGQLELAASGEENGQMWIAPSETVPLTPQFIEQFEVARRRGVPS